MLGVQVLFPVHAGLILKQLKRVLILFTFPSTCGDDSGIYGEFDCIDDFSTNKRG